MQPGAESTQQNAGEIDVDFGEASLFREPLTHQERIELQTHTLRIWMAAIVLLAFLLVNGAVLWSLHEALEFDIAMIKSHATGYERFINTAVITSVLGATTVQLGAIMFAVTKFFFGPNDVKSL